jgi:hypothetical protein
MSVYTRRQSRNDMEHIIMQTYHNLPQRASKKRQHHSHTVQGIFELSKRFKTLTSIRPDGLLVPQSCLETAHNMLPPNDACVRNIQNKPNACESRQTSPSNVPEVLVACKYPTVLNIDKPTLTHDSRALQCSGNAFMPVSLSTHTIEKNEPVTHHADAVHIQDTSIVEQLVTEIGCMKEHMVNHSFHIEQDVLIGSSWKEMMIHNETTWMPTTILSTLQHSTQPDETDMLQSSHLQPCSCSSVVFNEATPQSRTNKCNVNDMQFNCSQTDPSENTEWLSLTQTNTAVSQLSITNDNTMCADLGVHSVDEPLLHVPVAPVTDTHTCRLHDQPECQRCKRNGRRLREVCTPQISLNLSIAITDTMGISICKSLLTKDSPSSFLKKTPHCTTSPTGIHHCVTPLSNELYRDDRQKHTPGVWMVRLHRLYALIVRGLCMCNRSSVKQNADLHKIGGRSKDRQTGIRRSMKVKNH